MRLLKMHRQDTFEVHEFDGAVMRILELLCSLHRAGAYGVTVEILSC